MHSLRSVAKRIWLERSASRSQRYHDGYAKAYCLRNKSCGYSLALWLRLSPWTLAYAESSSK